MFVIAEFSKSHQKSFNSVQKYFIFVSIEPLPINIQTLGSLIGDAGVFSQVKILAILQETVIKAIHIINISKIK